MEDSVIPTDRCEFGKMHLEDKCLLFIQTEVSLVELCVTHLEKRSAMALVLPRVLTNESSLAVTRKDCDAHDLRLNELPPSISA